MASETVRIENRNGSWCLVVCGMVVGATLSKIEMISRASQYQIRTGRIVENLNEVAA